MRTIAHSRKRLDLRGPVASYRG